VCVCVCVFTSVSNALLSGIMSQSCIYQPNNQPAEMFSISYCCLVHAVVTSITMTMGMVPLNYASFTAIWTNEKSSRESYEMRHKC